MSSVTPLPSVNRDLEQYLQRYAAFKQRMMPKVGQTVTTTGLVQLGKMGLWMPFEDGEVWIYDTKESDLPKMNELMNRFDGHTVTVVGRLHHQDSSAPPDLPPDAEVAVHYSPDHFYFDIAEISMSEANTTH